MELPDNVLLVGLTHGEIDEGARSLNSELRGVGDGVNDRRRVQKGFRRYAAAVQAGAADFVSFDNGDAQAGTCSVQRSCVATWSAANDGHVEFRGGCLDVVVHCSPVALSLWKAGSHFLDGQVPVDAVGDDVLSGFEHEPHVVEMDHELVGLERHVVADPLDLIEGVFVSPRGLAGVTDVVVAADPLYGQKV